MAHTHISWKAPEYEYRVRSSDWYWAVWIIVISLAIISILFNDLLLAILIVLGVFTLTMMSKRQPRTIEYAVSNEGFRVGKRLYRHDELESFWIAEQDGMPTRLLIKSKKVFVPLITAFVENADPADIRSALLKYLYEERMDEPLSQKLLEWFGF